MNCKQKFSKVKWPLPTLVLFVTICIFSLSSLFLSASIPGVHAQAGLQQSNKHLAATIPQNESLSKPGGPATKELKVDTSSTAVANNGLLASDWTMYLSNNGHSGFNGTENILNAKTASGLKLYWTRQGGAAISAQPVVANGTIYWGSWDGLEHATNLDGKDIWSTNLGQTVDGNCDPSTVGVASTAALAPLKIKGASTLVLFVGGGNASFYALNAANGKILWSVSLGSSPSNFIWSSPLVYNGSVYIGVSSFGDCPAVQGNLYQLNAANGNIQNVFGIVPDGCIGGGLWGSPTIDNQTGELYIATGSPDSCWTTENLVSSVVELHASDLGFVSYWRVPRSQWVIDSDFGSAPTLFNANIGGVSRPLVGVAHKNGIYYAFVRGAIGDGPIWESRIAAGGSCPDCGQGSISPSAWDGSRLYVAGGITLIGGTLCRGSVRALDPATGGFLWEHCLYNGAVLAPVTMVRGVVIVEEGSAIDLIKADTGETLYTYTDTNGGSLFYGAASVSHGVVFVGNVDGNLYAFALGRNQKGWQERHQGLNAKEFSTNISGKTLRALLRFYEQMRRGAE